MFCCTLRYVYSSCAIILMGKREMIAFLGFFFLVSRDCVVALPCGAMVFSVVCDCVFTDHTHFFSMMIHCNG